MLLRRREARDSLTSFSRYISIPGVPINADAPDAPYDVVETPMAQHHLMILDMCQNLVENNLRYNPETLEPDPKGVACKRAMISMPPGSAKSTLASVLFPIWQMGRNPYYEVILCGYGSDICQRHGKRARQICASNGYRSVFSINVDPKTKAADNWSIENGSSYKSAGILSAITGFRCDLLISDDLVRGRSDADSRTIQNATYNAYVDDARTRKKPTAHEIMIGTRWHEEDVLGRILPEGYAGENGFIECRDGNVWYNLSIPAQCESENDPLGREIGEYIWPTWFSEDFWDDKKVNPRSWSSLYQQRPSPDEGLYFKKEWFKTYSTLPETLDYYISFDPAVTAEEDAADADDTAIQVWGVDTRARLYLVDEWVRKCTMDIWIAHLMVWISIYKPLAVISESGVIRRAAEPYIKRSMAQTGHFALFEWMSRNADKSAMARPAQAMTAAGQVYYPDNSVGDNTIDEMLRFPAAKADHRVDAKANLCLYLEKLWEASPPNKRNDDKGTIEHGFKISSIMPPRHSKKKSRWDK